jgi:uncharacterized membrane protein
MATLAEPIVLSPPAEPSERRVVAFAFDAAPRAHEVLLAAVRLEERGLLTLHDAVLVTRTPEGEVEVARTSDPAPVAAAVPTSLIGALIGTLIAGPIGLLVGGVLGGGSGAIAARLADAGIPDRVVTDLADETPPGGTSLALLVGDVAGSVVLDELRRFEGARGLHVLYAANPPAAVAAARAAAAVEPRVVP